MELISTHICKGSEIGVHNNMFGGSLMAYLDESAGAFASQLCDTPRMVTVSIDQCNFEKPVKESQLLKIYAKPTKVGTTSVTIYLEARAHNVYTGKQDLVLKTNIIFVQIDEGGNAIPIGDKARNRINLLITNK